MITRQITVGEGEDRVCLAVSNLDPDKIGVTVMTGATEDQDILTFTIAPSDLRRICGTLLEATA